MTEGFWKTLRDNTFAMWFGWTLAAAIVVFPATATIQSCWSEQVRENIEKAKLSTQEGDSHNMMKWMVSRGVHPLVARCAILNSPAVQCRNLIADLDEGERATIKELLINPLAEGKTGPVVVEAPVSPPKNPEEYVKGLDFGRVSPAQ